MVERHMVKRYNFEIFTKKLYGITLLLLKKYNSHDLKKEQFFYRNNSKILRDQKVRGSRVKKYSEIDSQKQEYCILHITFLHYIFDKSGGSSDHSDTPVTSSLNKNYKIINGATFYPMQW